MQEEFSPTKHGKRLNLVIHPDARKALDDRAKKEGKKLTRLLHEAIALLTGDRSFL